MNDRPSRRSWATEGLGSLQGPEGESVSQFFPNFEGQGDSKMRRHIRGRFLIHSRLSMLIPFPKWQQHPSSSSFPSAPETGSRQAAGSCSGEPLWGPDRAVHQTISRCTHLRCAVHCKSLPFKSPQLLCGGQLVATFGCFVSGFLCTFF